MSMKLWYQYPAPLSPFRTVVFEKVINAINTVKRPDTTVDVKPARRGAPSTRLYALDLTNLHTAVEVLAAISNAEKEGYDGVIIGQSLDPGLFAAKEALNIPVNGILEAATHFASLWGERFGLITIPTPPGYPKAKYAGNHVRNIERYGFGGKLVAVEEMSMSLEGLTQQIQASQHDEIVTKFERAARDCYEQGADVVIAGDTIISIVMLYENRLVIPGTGQIVVDLVSSGVKMAESLVDLHRSLGIVRSRAGDYAMGTAEDIATAKQAFGIE